MTGAQTSRAAARNPRVGSVAAVSRGPGPHQEGTADRRGRKSEDSALETRRGDQEAQIPERGSWDTNLRRADSDRGRAGAHAGRPHRRGTEVLHPLTSKRGERERNRKESRRVGSHGQGNGFEASAQPS